LTNLIIGFLAEPAIASLLEGPLTAVGVPEGAVPGVSVTLGLVLATIATMLFGELVPKKLGIAVPFPIARRTQALLRGFTKVMTYPIKLLNGSTPSARTIALADPLSSLIG